MSARDIQVLLATYNGERFLREQVDSIWAQTYSNVSILARDDGSSDGTLALLDEYARRFPNRFQLLPTGTPSGSAMTNFRSLLHASTAPYIAFADQDDIWVPEKLAREMDSMRDLEKQHGPETPLLVFSDLAVVDDRCAVLAPSFWTHRNLDPANIHHLERLLMENVVTGCTSVLNRALIQCARRMPNSAPMHDGWMALCACIFGHAAGISAPLVLYRQHENNAVGALRPNGESTLHRLWRNDRRRDRWRASVIQARELLDIYGDSLPQKEAITLQRLLACDTDPGRLRRLAIFLREGFFTGSVAGNLAAAWNLCFRHVPACRSREHSQRQESA